MRKLTLTVAALGLAVLFGTSLGLAARADNFSKLPEAVHTITPAVQLVGYKYCDYNGCYSCAYRECDDYYYCGYGYTRHKCCRHYSYSQCGPYGGGGGYKRRYYNGGGGGY
jgi:hypothetical protein